jgi:hypothetical protein
MKKIEKLVFVCIGDVAAQFMINTNTVRQNKVVLNEKEYPAVVSMNYMNYSNPLDYIKELKRMADGSTFFVFLVNKKEPNDFINYDHYVDLIKSAFHNEQHLIFVQKRYHAVDAATIIDNISATLAENDANGSAEGYHYEADGRVATSIPKKVIVVLGNSANLFFNLIRLDAQAKDSDFAFNHERDDYYFVGPNPQGCTPEDIADALKNLKKRFNSQNKYFIIIDELQAMAKGMLDLYDFLNTTNNGNAAQTLVIPRNYNGEKHPEHTSLKYALRQELRRLENMITEQTQNVKQEEEVQVEKKRNLKFIFISDELVEQVRTKSEFDNVKEILIQHEPDGAMVSYPKGKDANAFTENLIEDLALNYEPDTFCIIFAGMSVSKVGGVVYSNVMAELTQSSNYGSVVVWDDDYECDQKVRGEFLTKNLKLAIAHAKNQQNNQQRKETNVEQNEQESPKPELQQQIEDAVASAIAPYKSQLEHLNLYIRDVRQATSSQLEQLNASLRQIQMTLHHGGQFGPIPQMPNPFSKGFPNPFTPPFPGQYPNMPNWMIDPASVPHNPLNARHGFFSEATGLNRNPRDTITKEGEDKDRASLYPASAGRDFPTPPSVNQGIDASQSTAAPPSNPMTAVSPNLPEGLIRRPEGFELTTPAANKKSILVVGMGQDTFARVFEVMRDIYAQVPHRKLHEILEVVVVNYGQAVMTGQCAGFSDVCILCDKDSFNYNARRAEKIRQDILKAAPDKFQYSNIRSISYEQFASYLVGIEAGFNLYNGID